MPKQHVPKKRLVENQQTPAEALESFRVKAKAFTKQATKSQESALKVLVDMGIYTASGELTKNYR